ncbi:MAG: hypothetical protein KME42_14540 [Tildeniella nuda ZEHNDER 1965/U140]|nr:hypothetical protein [Tildeniella nuda ZEHNDER 1965/U140]
MVSGVTSQEPEGNTISLNCGYTNKLRLAVSGQRSAVSGQQSAVSGQRSAVSGQQQERICRAIL